MSERDENQKYPRLSVRMPARISTIDPETDPWTGNTFFRTSQETCANVSQGGAFVSTTESIPPGRRVLLELQIPGGRLVQAVGRVAWTRTAQAPRSPAGGNDQVGIGVEFVGGSREQRQELENFIARSLRRRRIADKPGSGYETADRR